MCHRICILCYVTSTPFSFPLFPFPPSLLPRPFLQPAWFLMVGGDRSFKLALTEKVKGFSNELREDCEVRGMEQSGGEREGTGGDGEREGTGGDGERDPNQ